MTPQLYENFMRKAFSCETNSIIGADEQIYRTMELYSKELYIDDSADTFQERMDDYRHSVTIVAGHIRRAITFSHAMIQHQLTSEQQQTLHSMQRTLMVKNFHDREQLDQIIVEASEMFEEFELLGAGELRS